MFSSLLFFSPRSGPWGGILETDLWGQINVLFSSLLLSALWPVGRDPGNRPVGSDQCSLLFSSSLRALARGEGSWKQTCGVRSVFSSLLFFSPRSGPWGGILETDLWGQISVLFS